MRNEVQAVYKNEPIVRRKRKKKRGTLKLKLFFFIIIISSLCFYILDNNFLGNTTISNNSRLNEINSNKKYYPKDFITLANNKAEAIDFVYGYKKFMENPDKYQAEDIDISKDYKEGEVPLFLQWDTRWGYLNYGESSSFIAISGCGPTSLAMVAVALTGDTSINPKTVADYSYSSGYYVKGEGTAWTLMSEGAKHYGLNVSQTNADDIIRSLKNGKVIIASMNPGDFTSTGHIIVLKGITKDNKILVNDPNSKDNSEKQWDIDVFKNQGANFWVYSI